LVTSFGVGGPCHATFFLRSHFANLHAWAHSKEQSKSQNKKFTLKACRHWPQSPHHPFLSSSLLVPGASGGFCLLVTSFGVGGPCHATFSGTKREEERKGNSHYFSGKSNASRTDPADHKRVQVGVAQTVARQASDQATAIAMQAPNIPSPSGPTGRGIAVGFSVLSLLAQHADHVVEGLLHVDTVLRGCLDKFTSQLLGQLVKESSSSGSPSGPSYLNSPMNASSGPAMPVPVMLGTR
jgi:hypothetical protein